MPSGRVWIAGTIGGLFEPGERVLIVYENDTFRLVDRAPITGQGIADLAVDADGFVWLAYHNRNGRISDLRVEQFAPSGQKLWQHDLPGAQFGGPFGGNQQFWNGGASEVSLLPAGQERVYVAYEWRTSVPTNARRMGVLLLDPARSTSTESLVDPSRLRLDAPLPNPSAQSAHVSLTLNAPARVTLAAYDLLGRRVALLADEMLPAGLHERTLDTSALSSGSYVLRLSDGASSHTQMLIVAR